MDKLRCLSGELKRLYGADIENAEIRYSTRNIVFMLKDTVIRVNLHPDARPLEEWMDELRLLRALKRCCSAVCAPIPSSEGRLIEFPEADGKRYAAVCFERAGGAVIQGQDIDPAHAEKLGQIMGMLHRAGALAEAEGLRFHRGDEGGILMQELSEDERAVLGEEVCERLLEMRDKLLSLEKLPGRNYGVIHGDLTQYNYFVDGDAIRLFDFDDCTCGFYAYDIGTLLQNWMMAPGLRITGSAAQTFGALLSAFRAGYARENHIEPSVWENVTFFMRVRLAGTLINMAKDSLDPTRKVAGFRGMSQQIPRMSELFMAEDLFAVLDRRAEQEKSRWVKIAALLKNGPDPNDPESMALYQQLQSPDMKPFVEAYLKSFTADAGGGEIGMNEKLMQKTAEMGCKYPVSVVTPFYKVDLGLFQKCFESLKAQTLGFENLEWIVVVHNSGPEYLQGVRKITDGCSNVQVHELNNDRHTPSSPRNYGLNFVQGAYVGFLDADDTYTPECLEKTAGYLSDNDAQIAVFRMETESDDPARMAVRQFLFVDQTRELVLLEKGKWDSRQFIYGAALNVTSKMYEMRFLNRQGIRFDEDVPFAEDNMFNLSAFARADRICILPQLIGYRYWLNGGSMVQTFDKTSDEVIRYAAGFKKVFETGFREKLYMNYVLCDLLGYESATLLASKALTLEDRIRVKDILGAYTELIEPIQESKLYTKQMAKSVCVLPKIVIMRPKLMDRISRLMKRLNVDVAAQISKNM